MGLMILFKVLLENVIGKSKHILMTLIYKFL